MNSIDGEVIANVIKTINSRRLFRYDCSSAEENAVSLFEKAFADYLGFDYAIAMNSCSSALFVSLLCCGVQPGSHVLMPAFTFIAIPSAIVHAGAQPVLVEVDENYVIDLDDLERKITPETKHLLLSHMRGRLCDMDKVKAVCKKHNVILIEDSAHALGVKWDGKPSGSFGQVAAYSMQSYKMLDGGEGGVMVTNDKEIALKAVLYSGCYEKNWKKHFNLEDDYSTLLEMTNKIPAYNFRMSNLSASALLPQIEKIEARAEKYNENYFHLVEYLKRDERIFIPSFLPKTRPVADTIQFRLNNISENRIKTFINRLKEQEYEISAFGLDATNARCFWHWEFFRKIHECNYTRELLKTTFDMRLCLHNKPEDIEKMGKTIIQVLDYC